MTKYILNKFPHTHYFSGGKANDIAFQLIKNKWDPDVCIFNFPRTSEGAVYNAIEQLKDGLVFSSKYEGGVKMFNPPHVIIFANWLPDVKTLSEDRWNIVNIGEGVIKPTHKTRAVSTVPFAGTPVRHTPLSHIDDKIKPSFIIE